MMGPGKYDDEVAVLMKSTNAALITLIVVGGEKGEGFSIQTSSPVLLKILPNMLRNMADQIENDASGI